MIPKKVYSEEEGQRKLREGIKLFCGPVKSTLGPSGKTVLVENENVLYGYRSTKDGVTVCKSMRFVDPVHDLVALMFREAAQKTADTAGDGTTTSILLTEAIVDAFDKYAPESGLTTVEITRGIQKISDLIVGELDKMSIPVTSEMIEQVATISTNNDPELGKLIADVFNKVDIVTVESSTTGETYTKIIDGVKIDKGYTSRYFINDPKKNECVLDNPYILLLDKEVKNIQSIAHIFQEVMKNNGSILVVGNFSVEATNSINYNVTQKGLKAAIVTPPAFGSLRGEKLEDLAYILSAKNYSDDTGDNLQMINMEGLGRAKRVVISSTETLIEPMDDAKERIEKRSKELKALKEESAPINIPDIESRIESACGTFGVIYVGAPTAVETEELRDRIDDAVCAVRAAKEEGVLPGGGVALFNAFTSVDESDDSIHDLCYEIMADVSSGPIDQMVENASLDIPVVSNILALPVGNGYNFKTNEFCNMVEAGVIDPAKVVKNALKNAVSVATTVLNTKHVITNLRETYKD